MSKLYTTLVIAAGIVVVAVAQPSYPHKATLNEAIAMRKYKLAEAGSREGLENDVNRLLKEGWFLEGGVACTKYGNKFSGYAYIQALSK